MATQKKKRDLVQEFLASGKADPVPGEPVPGPHPPIERQKGVDTRTRCKEVAYETLAPGERSFLDLLRPATYRKGRVKDLHPDVAVALDLLPETRLSLLSSLQFAAALAWDRALKARDDDGLPGCRSEHVIFVPMSDLMESDFQHRARLRRRLDELRGYYAGDDVAFVRAAYAEGIGGEWIRTYLPPRAKSRFAEKQRLRGRIKAAVSSLYMQHGNTEAFREELREHGLDPELGDKYVKLHIEAFGDEEPRWPADAKAAKELLDGVRARTDDAYFMVKERENKHDVRIEPRRKPAKGGGDKPARGSV